MVAGISGTLIPPGFLTDVFPSAFEAALNDARRHAPVTALLRWWRRVERETGPATSIRALFDIAARPLLDLLGFELEHAEPLGGSLVAVAAGGEARVIVLVPARGSMAGHAWRDVQRAARTAHARYAFVITGSSLNLLDAARTWSRRSLEFHFPLVMADERAIVTFWALASGAGLQGNLDDVIRAADAHAERVCASLSDGVLTSLGSLLRVMHRPAWGGSLSERHAFDQALTLVYRILFLLFAEARGTVPTWHRIYREAYTIDAMCRRSLESKRVTGLWDALLAISRLAHAGCRAGDLQVTAFNGRLFSPRHAPLVERSRVPDAVVREAVLALATRPTPAGRRRIAYGDLGVEQLGAVYERVLEHEPRTAQGSAGLVLARTSHERKSTGSFYTPRSITEFLVRRTLHPLVEHRAADEILNLRIVDPAMGSGAFLVAACRYLAVAVERARIGYGEWRADEVTPQDRVQVRRVVAQRCLYGVDRNPTAVQLARLSLWLTTLAADRSLTFLDHHLACGNSLIGATLEDIARQPPGRLRGRGMMSALPLFEHDAAGEMAGLVLPDRYRLALDPDDTPDAVRQKERALAGLVAPGTPLHTWKAAADLWCAGFFWPDRSLTPGVFGELLELLIRQSGTLPRRQARTLLDRASSISRELQPFHWHLEFPEVFFGADGRRDVAGGFDAVIGNPPWDVMRSDTGSRKDREVDRRTKRDELRFFRDAGIYHFQSGGHANRYQLFVERALQIVKPHGRLGLLLPSGIATDHGSAPLRRALFDSCRIERLLGFSNREGIFPIHRDMRFILLTATKGSATDHVACRFGVRRAAWLDTLPDDARDDPPEARPIVLSRALLTACDPEQLSWPELDDARDLEILAHVAGAVPALASPDGWNVRFGRELNATDDRASMKPRATAPASALPVVEGKHLEPFRVHVDRAVQAMPLEAAARRLDPERTFRRPRLAYREVASATNKLTLIAAVLPAGTVSTHTVFCARTALDLSSQYCLLALLNSLVANYLVRLQVTTHVTASVLARLRVPAPATMPERRSLIALAQRLESSGMDHDEAAYANLNAIVARLYGLSVDQYAHVVSRFPLLTPDLRERCIAAYRQKRD
jgi:hypothetical protein